MALNPAVAEARADALAAAVDLYQVQHTGIQVTVGYLPACVPADPLTEIRANAETFAAWLLGTTRLTLMRGQVVSQTTGQPTGTSTEGDTMQLHDDEKFALTVDTKDAKGFKTADSITWSADDGGAVVTLQVSDDSRSCEVLAVAPGSAVITVTDDAAGLSATEAIDVVAGGTATISFVEGAVEKQ